MSKIVVGFLLGVSVVLLLLTLGVFDMSGGSITLPPTPLPTAVPAQGGDQVYVPPPPTPLPTAVPTVLAEPLPAATMAVNDLSALETAIENTQRVLVACIQEVAVAVGNGEVGPDCEPIMRQLNQLEKQKEQAINEQ